MPFFKSKSFIYSSPFHLNNLLCDLSCFFEPSDLVTNGFSVRPRRITKIRTCLAGIKAVVSCKIVNGERCHKWLFSCLFCFLFGFWNHYKKMSAKTEQHFSQNVLISGFEVPTHLAKSVDKKPQRKMALHAGYRFHYLPCTVWCCLYITRITCYCQIKK